MEKHWLTLPTIKLKKNLANPSYTWLTMQLLNNRGITRAADIREFFQSENDTAWPDPFLFNDMAAAVSLIIEHIKNRHLIIVYGDYDADGVTAAAIVYEALAAVKARAEVYIPDRTSEGYGLNQGAITTIAALGAKLIITVDNGIRNKSEVDFARSLGLDVIITDHHVPPDRKRDWPACPLIDSHLAGEKYPFRNLSGAGVANKLAQALIGRSTLAEEKKQAIIESLWDIAAIGTVADCVPLLGENRLLVKKGLAVLNRTERLGLRELIKTVQLRNAGSLDAWNIAFQIAPRLNAAGRMEHANTAFELLTAKEKKEAALIALELDKKNSERQKITDGIADEVEVRVDPSAKIIISVYDRRDGGEIWNEGVIGLVAGRICEKYYRPALIITLSGSEYKGSGRSIPEFNIIEAVSLNGDLLSRFGGHPGACGFSLPKENLPKFVKALSEQAALKLAKTDLRPKLVIDARLRLEEVNNSVVEEISRFAPFGQGNERPKFVSYGVKIVDIMNMGSDGQHIKIKIQNDHSPLISALGFGQTEKWRDLRGGDIIDIVYFVEMNEFNGRREVQLKIVDIKPHNT